MNYINVFVTTLHVWLGCFGAVNGQMQSPADSATTLSEIVRSMVDYEARHSKLTWNEFDTSTTTERPGQTPSRQVVHASFQGKKGFSIQNTRTRFFDGDKETSNETTLQIGNPDYGASIIEKSGKFACENISAPVDVTKWVARFRRPLLELIKRPCFQSATVRLMPNQCEVTMPCDSDAELTQEYQSIVFLFQKNSDYWLPKTVEAKCQSSNSFKSLWKDYHWTTGTDFPTIQQQTYIEVFRSGTKRTCKDKIQIKLGEDFDESQCYLAHYGLPEPFRKKESFFEAWGVYLVPITIIIAVGILAWSKRRTGLTK